MESQIPQGLLHLPQAADVLAGLLLILAIDQGKLPGRGGGGLDLVQVGGVLPQEFPDSRELLCLQPLAVPVLVALEGLTGVQGQQADLLGAAQEIRQIFDPAADSLAGQDGQIIRFDHKKGQLPAGGFGAVVGELADPHELPRGLPLPQFLLLLSIQWFPPIRNTAVSKSKSIQHSGGSPEYWSPPAGCSERRRGR